jgi:hypothetical protein
MTAADDASTPYGFGVCSGPREFACPSLPSGAPAVWTTFPDTNRCCRFARGAAPRFATFPNRSECERWVRERRCRPGWEGFDGCNWYGCAANGAEVSRTLRDCALAVLQWIQFEPSSSELPPQARCDLQATIPQLLAVLRENRKIVIKGHHSSVDRAPERAARATLRAETVRAALIERGIPAESVATIATGEFPNGIEAPIPVVTFDIVPSQIPLELPQRQPPSCSELGDGG